MSRTTLSKNTEGSAFGLGTALIWGAMFVIAKSALGRVDPFHLTAIRYLVASLVLLAALAVVEGPDALRLDGRGQRPCQRGSEEGDGNEQQEQALIGRQPEPRLSQQRGTARRQRADGPGQGGDGVVHTEHVIPSPALEAGGQHGLFQRREGARLDN